MNPEPQENLDDLIAEEKRLVAEEHLLEAWNAGLLDGIETDILAASFAKRLLMQLARDNGHEAVSQLLSELKVQDDQGDFAPQKTLQ